MSFKLCEALVKVEDKEEAFQFWCNKEIGSKKSLGDAGATYLKNHPEAKGKEIQVMYVMQIPYKERKTINETRD